MIHLNKCKHIKINHKCIQINYQKNLPEATHLANSQSRQDRGKMFETFNCTFLNRIISAWFDDNLDDNSSSSLEEPSQLDSNASVRAGILFFMTTASLIGNLFTLVSIAVTNKKRSSSSSLHTLLIQVPQANNCLIQLLQFKNQSSYRNRNCCNQRQDTDPTLFLTLFI